MISKWVLVAGMISVAAVLAVPFWLVMRFINTMQERARAARDAAEDRAAEALVASIRRGARSPSVARVANNKKTTWPDAP